MIFIANKVGKHWNMIADAYKNSLKNKTADYLNSKYNNLKPNETLFQKLLVKSKLVKDFKIKKIDI